MSVKGIFFDAAGVLYTRARSTRQFVAGLLGARGLPLQLSPEDAARQQALRSAGNTGRLSADEYWDQVLEMHGVAGREERQDLVSRIDGFADQVVPVAGVRQALAGLKARGFVLGVITDTMHPLARKEQWLEAVGALEFLDVLACSTVLGLHKPDPAIYLRAVEQAGLAVDQAAFVGHAADELAGATRAGLLAVAVHHDPGAKADYYAGSLVDLLNIPIFAGSEAQEGNAWTV